MQIFSLRSNKKGFLSSCGCDCITGWMYHHDSNETNKKKLDENYVREIPTVLKKIPEAAPHKEAAVRPLTYHLKNNLHYTKKDARNCWESKDGVITDVLLWILTYGCASDD